MPTLLAPKSPAIQRLQLLHKARDYFQQNLDNLRDQGKRYVVLRGDEIVAAADDADICWQSALKARVPLTECLLFHVPQKGESYFY